MESTNKMGIENHIFRCIDSCDSRIKSISKKMCVLDSCVGCLTWISVAQEILLIYTAYKIIKLNNKIEEVKNSKGA